MRSAAAITILVVLLPLLLVPTETAARTWYIKADGTGDVPTIQAAIDTCVPGDLILVAAGRYTWANQGGSPPHAMIHIARGREGFILRSESGPEATILDAQRQNRVFFVDGLNDMEIDGFTVTGGLAPEFGDYWGGGIAIAHSHDVIRNCIIENNEAHFGGGIMTGGWGTLRIESCVIRNNTSLGKGGGIAAWATQTNQTIIDCDIYGNTADGGGGIYSGLAALTIENTVIVNNSATEGGGFYFREAWPTTVVGCTVSANDSPGGSAAYFTASSAVSFERTIFGFNIGSTMFSLNSGSAPGVGCCDIFGNIGDPVGDAIPPGAVDNGHNIFSNPQFCNATWAPDPTVKETSPCLPGNHPNAAACGLIGARQAGCGAVPVEATTWGGLKAKYR
jgi:hypothetical protein